MTAESPAAAACSGPLQPLAEYSLVQYSLHSIGFERPVLTGRMAPPQLRHHLPWHDQAAVRGAIEGLGCKVQGIFRV